MLSTGGSVGLIFVVGAIGVWGPQYVVLSRKVLLDYSQSTEEYGNLLDLLFVVITLIIEN